MKLLIIILGIILLYLLFFQENFDNSANLNLQMSNPSLLDLPVEYPIDLSIVDDNETPKQYEFNKKVTITDLQKLKAINNILERVKEIHEYGVFNPALQPTREFVPNVRNFSDINTYIINQLSYYSGNQYKLKISNVDSASGIETDDQFFISYILYANIDNLQFKIIVSVIITKPNATKELTINFDILRIDNPNIYITPNNPDTNYALIT
jgi:hypothetical protein